MSRGTKGTVESHQLESRETTFRVNGTAGGGGVFTFGGRNGTLTHNGVGDYTIALSRPGRHFLNAIIAMETKGYAQIVMPTAASIQILTFNDAGAALESDFWLTFMVSDSPYEF